MGSFLEPVPTIRAKTVETLELSEHYSYLPPYFQCWKNAQKSIKTTPHSINIEREGVGGGVFQRVVAGIVALTLQAAARTRRKSERKTNA